MTKDSTLAMGGFLSVWIMDKLGIMANDRVASWGRNQMKIKNKLAARRSTAAAQRVGEVITRKSVGSAQIGDTSFLLVLTKSFLCLHT